MLLNAAARAACRDLRTREEVSSFNELQTILRTPRPRTLLLLSAPARAWPPKSASVTAFCPADHYSAPTSTGRRSLRYPVPKVH